MDQKRMMENLRALCAQPSVSGSEAERAMPKTLRALLLQVPALAARPELIGLLPVGEGAAGGENVFALLPAPRKTAKTVLLLSHYDVVDVDEYGENRALAFDPDAYTARLREGGVTLPEQARADLDSGNFLFGRGVCDMKWGISVELELLHHYSERPGEQRVNLLFVSTPDEERNSAGMLSAAGQLLALREKHGLEIICCLVGEPDISPEGGRDARKLHVGAAGKLMPLFYCVGRETHVGEPFRGLNPDLLLAQLTAEMELSPDFIDAANGCHTPAPTCLKQSDLKEAYSVQTPCAAYAYFNAMTLRNTPERMLELMERAARRAFERTLALLEEKHAAAEARLGRAVRREPLQPKVLRFGELYRLCERAHGERFRAHMDAFLRGCPETDLRMLTVRVIREAHGFCPDRDPMIILCFAPPYYPHSGFPAEDSPTARACRALVGEARGLGEALEVDPCFNGLTDMCYLSLRGPVDLAALRESFPVWGGRYAVPLEEIRALDIPFINFSPLGRDPHKYTERVDLDYSFGKAPGLLLRLVELLARFA